MGVLCQVRATESSQSNTPCKHDRTNCTNMLSKDTAINIHDFQIKKQLLRIHSEWTGLIEELVGNDAFFQNQDNALFGQHDIKV
jgi:hypothetical protein